jgi:hypothetical protein
MGGAATFQILHARRAGFSLSESCVYNVVSTLTMMVAFQWFNKQADGYYERSIGVGSTSTLYDDRTIEVNRHRKQQFPRETIVALLASYVLGWIAGSFASAIQDFPRSTQHMSTTVILSATAFGVHSLVLWASKGLEFEAKK